jgi:peptidyl-prolyl cis-trans isomerase SurA
MKRGPFLPLLCMNERLPSALIAALVAMLFSSVVQHAHAQGTSQARDPAPAPAARARPRTATPPPEPAPAPAASGLSFGDTVFGRLPQQAAEPAAAPARPANAPRAAGSAGDYIVAVVGQELVTAFEVEQRMAAVKQALRPGERAPDDADLRKQTLDGLIDERIVLVHARDNGAKVDDPELDRAVQAVASQNKVSVQQLRAAVQREGIDWSRFRQQLRDQLLIERVREREVNARIKMTDVEIDDWVARRRGGASAAGEPEYTVSQILVALPDKPDEATLARQRIKAEALLVRAKGREDFAAIAREASDDAASREQGGSMGARPAGRLPDAFVEVVRKLEAGVVAPQLLQTGAGFHVLKLVQRRDASDVLTVTETRARHILVRPAPGATAQAVRQQLLDLKRQIESGSRRFEDAAKQFSQDDTAERGGDLGWAAPGNFVTEFETALERLGPGAISEPVTTRFGQHLIQVVERRGTQVNARQFREQARTSLRGERFDKAYGEWLDELRARAYVERRETP